MNTEKNLEFIKQLLVIALVIALVALVYVQQV